MSNKFYIPCWIIAGLLLGALVLPAQAATLRLKAKVPLTGSCLARPSGLLVQQEWKALPAGGKPCATLYDWRGRMRWRISLPVPSTDGWQMGVTKVEKPGNGELSVLSFAPGGHYLALLQPSPLGLRVMRWHDGIALPAFTVPLQKAECVLTGRFPYALAILDDGCIWVYRSIGRDAPLWLYAANGTLTARGSDPGPTSEAYQTRRLADDGSVLLENYEHESSLNHRCDICTLAVNTGTIQVVRQAANLSGFGRPVNRGYAILTDGMPDDIEDTLYDLHSLPAPLGNGRHSVHVSVGSGSCVKNTDTAFRIFELSSHQSWEYQLPTRKSGPWMPSDDGRWLLCEVEDISSAHGDWIAHLPTKQQRAWARRNELRVVERPGTVRAHLPLSQHEGTDYLDATHAIMPACCNPTLSPDGHTVVLAVSDEKRNTISLRWYGW